MNPSISSLRVLFSSIRVVAVLLIGLSVAALVHAALDGPRWLLLVSVPVTSLILTVLGDLADPTGTNSAMPPRSGRPRAFAPALVNGVRTVDKKTGRPVRDGRSVESVFAFDLTVMADELPAYRIRVCHPLDLQGLLHKSRAVVEYDLEQPWRVAVADNPPREWLARANAATPPAAVKEPSSRIPSGLWTLLMGVGLAAVLLVLFRMLG
jgi:hypothetical protein